jgi:glutamate formiminotransferase / formiminotetrahydrofolate cyclodeaminase
MRKIVECVPNFSEGKDRKIIEEITKAIESVDGIELADVDPGAETNRTVVTFFGEPEKVEEAAFRAIAKASEIIDMSKQHGSHPRMGATDVCPFIPVQDVTMEECVEMSKRVGKRVGEELKIPVYLYEYAAQNEARRNLANIRRGEYEGLEEKLKDKEWKPDFGPVKFNARNGATVMGAREFLIALNIDLNSTSKDYATDIAFELREKGRSVRSGNIKPFYFRGKLLKHEKGKYLCGECDFTAKETAELFDHIQKVHGYDGKKHYELNDIAPEKLDGESVKKGGHFKCVKAIGWEIPEYKRCQISINLTNYKVSPPHLVLEKARELAAERGIVITGSEIVGLIPLEALKQSGEYYLEKQGRSKGIPVEDILETAIQSMGLRDVAPFDVKEKVIGYREPAEKDLIALTSKGFADEVSRESPAPGGGSVAALAGSLGAALASMVANLTHGKAGYEKHFERMGQIAVEAQKIKDELLIQVDDDSKAFGTYMDALRLPKNTDEEKAHRKAKMQEGLKTAIIVPLRTAELGLAALRLALEVGENGNKNSQSDAGVGAEMAFTGVVGGLLNVLINLKGIEDEAYKNEMRGKCKTLYKEALELRDKALDVTLKKIGENLL